MDENYHFAFTVIIQYFSQIVSDIRAVSIGSQNRTILSKRVSVLLTRVASARREVRDTNYFAISPQKKRRNHAEGKSLKRGHLNLPRYLPTFPIHWQENGRGGGLSGSTHYSRVSAAGAKQACNFCHLRV